MVHLEPSLHTLLLGLLSDDADTGSTFFRGLLLKELQRRDKLDSDTFARLAGIGR